MTLEDLDFDNFISDSVNNDIDTDNVDNIDNDVDDMFSNPDTPDDADVNTDSIDVDTDEPEEVVERVIKPTETNTDDDVETDDTPKLFFEYLQKNNFIMPNEDFEFDGSDEKFEEAIIQTKDNIRLEVFGDLMDRLPEKIKDAVTFSLKSGGRDLDDYINSNRSIDWQSLDLMNEDVQRGIMAHYYKNVSKLDDTKIEKYITRLEKAGDLEQEAIDAVEYLKELEEQTKEETLRYHQQQEAAREEAARQYRESIKSNIDQAIYIEPERKQKIKNFLFNEKRTRDGVYTEYNLVLSNIAKKPDHMAQLADILLDYKQDEGFNFDRFKAKAKTAAVKNLKVQLNDIKSSAKAGMQTNPVKINSKKDFDLADFLNNLK